MCDKLSNNQVDILSAELDAAMAKLAEYEDDHKAMKHLRGWLGVCDVVNETKRIVRYHCDRAKLLVRAEQLLVDAGAPRGNVIMSIEMMISERDNYKAYRELMLKAINDELARVNQDVIEFD